MSLQSNKARIYELNSLIRQKSGEIKSLRAEVAKLKEDEKKYSNLDAKVNEEIISLNDAKKTATEGIEKIKKGYIGQKSQKKTKECEEIETDIESIINTLNEVLNEAKKEVEVISKKISEKEKIISALNQEIAALENELNYRYSMQTS